MSPTAIRTAVASIVAGLALVPAAALAQDVAATQRIHITSAYSYVDKPMAPHDTRNVVVVFRMAARLPDRATSVDGGGQQSQAFPGARCFSMIAESQGHKLGPFGRPANVGSKHTLKVWTYPNGVQAPSISDSITFGVRRRGSRAAASRHLGC